MTHYIQFSDCISSKRIEKTNLVVGWYNTLKLFLETPWQKAEIRYFSNDCCVNCYAGTKKEDLWAFLSARIVVYNVMPKKKKTHISSTVTFMESTLWRNMNQRRLFLCPASWVISHRVNPRSEACLLWEGAVAAVSNLRHCKDNDKTDAAPPPQTPQGMGGRLSAFVNTNFTPLSNEF